MKTVTFSHPGGASAQLRPTHAALVAARLGGDLRIAPDGLEIRAGALADAAGEVRDAYRCRTVRKELRRISLVGIEGAASNRDIAIACEDPDTLSAMVGAALAGPTGPGTKD